MHYRSTFGSKFVPNATKIENAILQLLSGIVSYSTLVNSRCAQPSLRALTPRHWHFFTLDNMQLAHDLKTLFKQILNTVFGVFLKIDTRSHGLDKQNAIDRYSQPKEIRTRRLGRVEPSRQKCLRVLINLIESQKF